MLEFIRLFESMHWFAQLFAIICQNRAAFKCGHSCRKCPSPTKEWNTLNIWAFDQFRPAIEHLLPFRISIANRTGHELVIRQLAGHSPVAALSGRLHCARLHLFSSSNYQLWSKCNVLLSIPALFNYYHIFERIIAWFEYQKSNFLNKFVIVCDFICSFAVFADHLLFAITLDSEHFWNQNTWTTSSFDSLSNVTDVI